MKIAKRLLLSLLLIIVAEIGTAQVEINGINYILHDDGTAEVTKGYYKYINDIVIPENITYKGNNYPVTSIGKKAFIGENYGIDEMIINIATILSQKVIVAKGRLAILSIPNSVTSIGDSAFLFNMHFTSIAIPNSVTSIGKSAFWGCSGITSINIPNSVKSIGDDAFSWCPSVMSIEVASDNKYFDSRDNCNAIIEKKNNTLIAGCENTIIPNSVTSIGKGAFFGCSRLTSINIPKSVTSIGDDAFSYCLSLKSIKVASDNEKYDSRDNCNAIIEKKSNVLVAGCKNSDIPKSVTSIGKGAFKQCRGLTTIKIPKSVTSIGDFAFADCI